jgi:hypothetical protein
MRRSTQTKTPPPLQFPAAAVAAAVYTPNARNTDWAAIRGMVPGSNININSDIKGWLSFAPMLYLVLFFFCERFFSCHYFHWTCLIAFSPGGQGGAAFITPSKMPNFRDDVAMASMIINKRVHQSGGGKSSKKRKIGEWWLDFGCNCWCTEIFIDCVVIYVYEL